MTYAARASQALRRCCGLALLHGFLASFAALAEGGPPTRTAAAPAAPGLFAAPTQKTAYTVGISGYRHSLKSANGHEVLGNAGAMQLGIDYLADSWFAALSLDILLGPYEPTQGGQLVVDYLGTGLTGWIGLSAQTLSLRSVAGGYGFALGLSYADMVGRSIGKNRRERPGNDRDNAALVDNYILRVNSLALMPAIFFTWLEGARPRGNTPALLATRLEGYILTIGMAVPVMSTYQAHYDIRGWNNPRDKTVEPTDDPPPDSPSDPKRQGPLAGRNVASHGALRGFSTLLSFSAIISP